MIPTVEEVLSRLISIGADGVDPDQYEYELGVLNEAKASWEQSQRGKSEGIVHKWIVVYADKYEGDYILSDKDVDKLCHAILNAKED